MSPMPKAGQLLWRGCSCDEFARILRVGKDANDADVLDLELIESVNELYFPRYQDESDEDRMGCLTKIVVPDGIKIVLRDVRWKPCTDRSIQIAASTGGCFRCTEHFYPHDEGQPVFPEGF